MYGDKSYLLDEKRAGQAVNMALPAIEAVMQQLGRPNLHIVVLNPGLPRESVYDLTDAILYERSLGDRSSWPHDYDVIARSKAEVALRTGMPAHLVQQRAPFLYTEGNTRHGGSVVFEGLVVACSGVPWYFDQMFSYWISAASQALCIQAMEPILQSDTDFLGDNAFVGGNEIEPGTFHDENKED